MSKDEFDKLFQYLQEFRLDVDKQFKGADKRFDQVLSHIDGLAKLITDYHQEFLMLSHKVDRLERWIHQIADKTGVKLSSD